MTHRFHLLCSTAPVVVIGYDSMIPTADQVDAAQGAQPSNQFEKRSPDSAYMLRYWDKVDAVMEGVDGMRNASTDFLPKFRDEEPEDYAFRLQCTKFTNVYRDIVEGLSAKPFEQPVELIRDEADARKYDMPTTNVSPIPEQIDKFVWDVDGSGNNLTVFAAHTFFQGVNNAIDWIMVDHEKRDPTVRSLADMRARGLRPYWSHILARNVLDVESRIEGGTEVLTYIKILEPGAPDHIREFKRTDRYDNNGRRITEVVWRLWCKNDKKKYILIDSGDVSIGVIPLVPFVTGRRDGRRWRFDPPMKAVVDASINLFKQESELEYKSTMSAYSMLAGNGIAPPKGPDGKPNYKIAVGPSRVLWTEPNASGAPAGKWQWIEPSSEILKFLQDRIDKTIQNLRELGRQPLTASSSNITVITAAVAAGKAKSAVKAWAYKLKDTLENALALTALWMAVEYEPTVHVYAEFDDWMEGEDIDALLAMWRPDGNGQRGISTQTLHEEMKRRGVLSSNFTSERETIRLLAELPGVDMIDEPEQVA